MKEETQVVYISEDGNFRSTRKVDVENYENAVNNYVKEEWYPAGTLQFTIYFKRKCHSEPLDSYLEIEESDSGRYRLYSADGYGDPGYHFWDKKSFDDLQVKNSTHRIEKKVPVKIDTVQQKAVADSLTKDSLAKVAAVPVQKSTKKWTSKNKWSSKKNTKKKWRPKKRQTH